MTSTSETVSKYQLRDTSIPEKTFCMKADVASSEGVNNVELVRYYNDNCPYKTPGQIENSSVRQGIDGFPIVIFWHDSVNNTTTFLGKYNFNNDKSTEDTFGFADDDESWEIKNNTSDLVRWKSDDYTQQSIDPDTGNPYPSWYDDFEARYPDIDPVYVDNTQLQAFSTWLVSTDPDQATDQILSSAKTYDGITYRLDTAEYRLAKFNAEVENYVEIESAYFMYLFTEVFLMVDSRCKNAFPSFMGAAISSGND